MAGNKKQIQGIQVEDNPFLTVKETAAHLHLCEKQVRHLINRGEIVAYSFGAAIRIKPEDRDTYVASRRVIPVNKKR